MGRRAKLKTAAEAFNLGVQIGKSANRCELGRCPGGVVGKVESKERSNRIVEAYYGGVGLRSEREI